MVSGAVYVSAIKCTAVEAAPPGESCDNYVTFIGDMFTLLALFYVLLVYSNRALNRFKDTHNGCLPFYLKGSLFHAVEVFSWL